MSSLLIIVSLQKSGRGAHFRYGSFRASPETVMEFREAYSQHAFLFLARDPASRLYCFGIKGTARCRLSKCYSNALRRLRNHREGRTEDE